MQPGATITPGSQNPDPQTPVAPPQETPQATPGPPVQPEPAQASETTNEQSGWTFNPGASDTATAVPATQHTNTNPVSWTASEYIAHDKNLGWYMLVGVATFALAAGLYLVTEDIISAAVIGVVGVSFGAFAARKPQVLQYAIDSGGVHIGQKMYPYRLFRAFSILEEGAAHSILLMPMQRFNLPISMYYDPTDEVKIVEAIGSYLPHEIRKPAAVDNFMRKIRF